MWRLLEPIHAVVYFAPDARARFEAVGLKGFWMGYFASRAAALGTAGPDLVTATFYVFHPAMVSRALPDAWSRSSPEAVLAARSSLADATLRRSLGDLASEPRVRAAAEVAVGLAQQAPRAGRPLGGAHAALAPPDDPLGRLWWAATALREHRGDGHVAALLTAGIGPCEALVLAAAAGAAGPDGADLLQQSRQWPDHEWAAATHRLASRDWLDDNGALTDAGRDARQRVEQLTDETAAAAYADLDGSELDTFEAALAPITSAVLASGALPRFNPIGLDAAPPAR
jgi:hypothetical protein